MMHVTPQDPPPPAGLRSGSISEEVLVRLARLEEQMRHVAVAVERLAGRDAELDVSLRNLSDRFTAALAQQAETFRDSLKDITERFVSREDWAFWKTLLTAAVLGMIAFGWHTLISGMPRR